MPINKITVPHPEIVKFPGSELSTDIAAAVTSASILNNVDIASNDLLLFGSYNQEEAEVVTCSGKSGNNTISFTTTKFAHVEGTPVTKVDFDRVLLERCSTETGTFTQISTISLQVDEIQNSYRDDTTFSSAWYKYRYFADGVTGSYSDAWNIDYKETSLYELKQMVKLISGKTESETNLKRLLNWYQRKICSSYNYPFMETTTAASAVADQVTYSLPSNCKLIKGIKVSRSNNFYYPGYLSFPAFTEIQDSTPSSTIPSYWTVIGGTSILFHNPFSALGTNNITYTYIRYPTVLDSDNDTTIIPLPDALVNAVAYQLVRHTNPEKAGDIKRDYLEAIQELRAMMGVDQMAEFPQVEYGQAIFEEIKEISTT